MKFLLPIITVVCLAMTAVAAPPKAIDVGSIQDKVSIKLDRQVSIQFTAKGDRLVQPKSVKHRDGNKATVDIALKTTDATPVAVRGVATRPYLAVSHGFDRPLHYRALARRKGSKEFFEVEWAGGDVEPGEHATRCWESGSRVEEVVLYQFTLSPKPSK